MVHYMYYTTIKVQYSTQHTIYQVLYPLQFLPVGQCECAVAAKQEEQVWRLRNIQTHIVPVVKVLVAVLLCECDGCQLVSLLHEVLVGQEVEGSLLVGFYGVLDTCSREHTYIHTYVHVSRESELSSDTKREYNLEKCWIRMLKLRRF